MLLQNTILAVSALRSKYVLCVTLQSSMNACILQHPGHIYSKLAISVCLTSKTLVVPMFQQISQGNIHCVLFIALLLLVTQIQKHACGCLQETVRSLTEYILVVNPDTSEALISHIKVCDRPPQNASVTLLSEACWQVLCKSTLHVAMSRKGCSRSGIHMCIIHDTECSCVSCRVVSFALTVSPGTSYSNP